MPVSLLLVWMHCLLHNNGKAPLYTWIKRKDRNRMFYEELEQNTQKKKKKKDMEQLDHIQKEISKRS